MRIYIYGVRKYAKNFMPKWTGRDGMEGLEDRYKEGDEYNWKELKQKTTGRANLGGLPFSRVKQFTCGYRYKSNGKIAKCQVKGCYERGVWLIEHKGKTILLCFNHGDEA